MFTKAFNRARHAIDGVAIEAAFSLAALILACGAIFLAAGGLAWWLSMQMAVHVALLITAAATGVCAAVVYLIGHNIDAPAAASPERKEDPSPFHALMESLGSLGPPLDAMAAGLVARQFRRSPVSAIAALVAVGAVLGALNAAGEDDAE